MEEKAHATSGVDQLDRILGGLYIGDNVVWHDDAGSLASVFCMNFIRASHARNKPLIYVSFDRSPKNLFDHLGPLVENPRFTILDCFTFGKGEGSDIFLKFYEEKRAHAQCRIIRVDEPHDSNRVMEALYSIHAAMEGDVRFVFESLAGMQELWGGEERIITFYSHTCPRLYELNTIAYWIMEKRAHSQRLKARINQIAQVALDLSIRRGKTYLTVLKAERRNLEVVNTPYLYWSRDLDIHFDIEKGSETPFNLGTRLRELRTKRGLSQTDLAKRIGVTSSTISQVESNMISPSLPALLKMAEILLVEVASFFQASDARGARVLFPATKSSRVKFPDLPPGSILAERLTPVDFNGKSEPYIVEIPPGESLSTHFFVHKGEEMGYLISGELEFRIKDTPFKAAQGDVIYLTSQLPTGWKNPGKVPARMLWLKIS